MSRSEFTAALTKKVGLQNWKYFQEATDRFGGCDMPDGIYWTKLTSIRTEITDKGTPYVAFTWTVVEGDYEGQRPSKAHFLEEKGNKTMQMALEMLSVDLQAMGVPPETSMEDVEGACELLVKTKPKVKISYANPPEENPTWSPDVNILACETEPWDKDDAAAKTGKEEFKKKEEKQDSQTQDADSGNAAEEQTSTDDKPSEDEAMEVVPEVGDIALVAPEGRGRPSRCTVIEVDEDAETCKVKRIADKKIFTDVSFARLDFEDEIPF